MKIICVLPARLASTRLPTKVLRPLAGKPLIQHTYEKAMAANCFDRVLVACDDKRIKDVVEGFGGQAVLTSKDHQSGTSRIAEAVEKLGYELIVNLQADEPLVHPDALSVLAKGMTKAGVELGTLAVRNTKIDEWKNPNVVKVVLDEKGDALYFSRAPIPYGRDQEPKEFLKHLGIYAYRFDTLMQFKNLKASPLEDIEKLEQLRFLSSGYRIRVWMTQYESVGVDTLADFERVEAILSAKQ